MGKLQARLQKGLDRRRVGQVPTFRSHEERESSQSSQIFDGQRGSTFENDLSQVLEAIEVRDGHQLGHRNLSDGAHDLKSESRILDKFDLAGFESGQDQSSDLADIGLGNRVHHGRGIGSVRCL